MNGISHKFFTFQSSPLVRCYLGYYDSLRFCRFCGLVDFAFLLMKLNNKKDKLIKLLEKEKQESFETQMLHLERQKNQLLQEGYDELHRKFLATNSLLIDYESNY